jgi:hypothetical protein
MSKTGMSPWNPISWVCALGATLTDPLERALIRCQDEKKQPAKADTIASDKKARG